MKHKSGLARGWVQKGDSDLAPVERTINSDGLLYDTACFHAQGMLDTIIQKIVQAVHPKKIILFGSYAWGNPSVDSDVDLFVIVDTSDEPGYRRARSVYAALRGVVVPIDLIVKTQEEVQQSANVVTSLTKKVLEEGKVLYG